MGGLPTARRGGTVTHCRVVVESTTLSWGCLRLLMVVQGMTLTEAFLSTRTPWIEE